MRKKDSNELYQKNPVVIYHNDLASLPLNDLTAVERKFFMTIISKLQDRGQTKIRIPYSEIRSLSQYRSSSKKRFVDSISAMNAKLASKTINLKSSVSDENEMPKTLTLTLFNFFLNDPIENYVEVQINSSFAYLLNNITVNFTKFELLEHNSLSSTHSMTVYTRLKSFRTTGVWNVSYDEFKELLGISQCRSSDIDKFVLARIKTELTPLFRDFRIQKVYSNEHGKPLDRLIFLFTPEKSQRALPANETNHSPTELSPHICPVCGKPLIHKKINEAWCFCHADGWKPDAECKKIFNSVAEIEDYAEIPTRDQPDFIPISDSLPTDLKEILNRHINNISEEKPSDE